MESLVFYDYTDASALDFLSLGTVAPASSDDSQYFVYNTSDTYQASDVTVSVTGGDADQLLLSLDGDTFTASVDVGEVAPHGSSLPFWLRRITPSTAAARDHQAFLSAQPGAWTAPVDTTASDDLPLDTPDGE